MPISEWKRGRGRAFDTSAVGSWRLALRCAFWRSTSPIQGHAAGYMAGPISEPRSDSERKVCTVPPSDAWVSEGSEPRPLNKIKHRSTPALSFPSRQDSERHCPFHLKDSSLRRLASQIANLPGEFFPYLDTGSGWLVVTKDHPRQHPRAVSRA